jgi:hypothetical protein
VLTVDASQLGDEGVSAQEGWCSLGFLSPGTLVVDSSSLSVCCVHTGIFTHSHLGADYGDDASEVENNLRGGVSAGRLVKPSVVDADPSLCRSVFWVCSFLISTASQSVQSDVILLYHGFYQSHDQLLLLFEQLVVPRVTQRRPAQPGVPCSDKSPVVRDRDSLISTVFV